jgi:hypothetical protein
VDFDLAGAIHLNHPGTLYITGGDSSVLYQLRTTLIEDVAFMPTWHPLTVRIQAPSLTYAVPEYHSAMSSPAPLAYAIAGHTGTLDHVRVPVCGGGVVTVGATDSTLTTYWWG